MAGIDLRVGLTKEQARAIYALGEEAVVFALLEQAYVLCFRLKFVKIYAIKRRGQSPVEVVKKGIKTYIETGNLPTLGQLLRFR